MDLTQETPSDGMELGFQNPDTGEYIWKVEEGIGLWEPEEHLARAIMVPLSPDSVVNGNGSEDSIGRRATYFIMIHNKEGKPIEFGEKQLVNFLHCTGMLESFAKKFDKVDPLDEKFLGALQMRLPGKFVRAKGERAKDKNDKDRFNFLGVHPVAQDKKTTKAKKAASGDDWD